MSEIQRLRTCAIMSSTIKTSINMTHLALNFSHYVNGVAKKHGEVSRLMFGGYSIDSITNGVHAATWTADAFQRLYDRYIPGWRQDNFNLRYAMSIPHEAIWQSHTEAKKHSSTTSTRKPIPAWM